MIKLLITAAIIFLYIHYFYPQSWGFYTADSNIPIYNMYAIHKDNPNNKIGDMPLLNNYMSYGIGISRKGKLLYNDIYKIIKKDLQWKPLVEDSINSVIQQNNYVSVSLSNSFIPAGNFIIIKTERPTYLDLKKQEQFRPFKQYVLVHINK